MQKAARWAYLGLASLLALAALFFALPLGRPAFMHAPVSTGTALVGGPFSLINQRGETVTEKTYLGHFALLFFGFSHCKDICPTELQVMASALQDLGPAAANITPIFVSIDPERDTPPVLAAYVANFGPGLQGLTGSAEQVAAMAKAYHVYYRKVPGPDPQDYEMEHSTTIYLMGPDGTFIKHFEYTTDTKALAESLKSVLR
ncbi:MAG: SCO family protein [Alphaproteobacteria bacterium]|nr:SCO family protein [Alphaproteobacteria bacterium]